MAAGQEQGRVAYPRLPNPLTADDLRQLFTPWPDEIEWAFNATPIVEARLGLLTLLKVFETLGRFIGPEEISPELVRHIAGHIGVPGRELAYAKNTLYRHQKLVREFVGVSKWNAKARQVAEATMVQLAAARTQPADLINGAIEALVRERFELPALSTLRRMAGTAQQRSHNQLFDRVAKHLTAAHRASLDELLEVPNDGQESPFAKLCRPPGRATTKNLKAQARHLDWLKTLAVPPAALAGIMPVKIEQWADEARRLIATELREYQAPRRHALLVALVHVTRGRILDDLVTMLIKSVRKIRHHAQADLQQWLDEQQESSEQLIVILLSFVPTKARRSRRNFIVRPA